MIWAAEIKNYRIFYGTESPWKDKEAELSPPYKALITLTDTIGDKFAWIQFDDNVRTDITKVRIGPKTKIFHKTNMRNYQNFVDILRNEKPVAMAYSHLGETSRDIFYLFTLAEPLGEGNTDSD